MASWPAAAQGVRLHESQRGYTNQRHQSSLHARSRTNGRLGRGSFGAGARGRARGSLATGRASVSAVPMDAEASGPRSRTAWVGMQPNYKLERSGKHRGPRLTAARRSVAGRSTGRYASRSSTRSSSVIVPRFVSATPSAVHRRAPPHDRLPNGGLLTILVASRRAGLPSARAPLAASVAEQPCQGLSSRITNHRSGRVNHRGPRLAAAWSSGPAAHFTR